MVCRSSGRGVVGESAHDVLCECRDAEALGGDEIRVLEGNVGPDLDAVAVDEVLALGDVLLGWMAMSLTELDFGVLLWTGLS